MDIEIIEMDINSTLEAKTKIENKKQKKENELTSNNIFKQISKIFGVITLVLIVGASFTLKHLNTERTTTLKSLAKANEKEVKIKQSNERNKEIRQLKIIIDELNIRKTPGTEAEKIGIVSKDEVYDVLEVSSDEYYIWYKIKTNTKIVGYIATYRLDTLEYEENYIELLNKEQ